MSQEKLQTTVMQRFWGGNRGVLWDCASSELLYSELHRNWEIFLTLYQNETTSFRSPCKLIFSCTYCVSISNLAKILLVLASHISDISLPVV